MEEKVFSAEHHEEVIDLLEIVSPRTAQASSEGVLPDDEIIELMPDFIEKSSDSGDVVSDKPEAGDEADPAAGSEESDGAAPALQSSAGEVEVLRDSQFLSADYAAIADERFAALEQRIFAQEEMYLEELERLEAQLREAEGKCEALSARVEELQRQLSECSSNFLEDASLRLALEDIVSCMLDARMPLAPEEEGNGVAVPELDESQVEPCAVAESPAESPSETEENAQEQGELETVEDEPAAEEPREVQENMHYGDRIRQLEDRVEVLEALEKRVTEWESRCEQEAALAAARIIREEIAVMRAASARSGL